MLTKEEALTLLGLTVKAKKKDINAAFREKALKLHPDKNKISSAQEEFIKLINARDLLLSLADSDLNNNSEDDFSEEFSNSFYQSNLNFSRQDRLKQRMILQITLMINSQNLPLLPAGILVMILMAYI